MDKQQRNADGLEKNIGQSENFDELIAVIGQSEGIMEDNVFLSSDYLIKRLGYLRKYQDPNGLYLIPETLGLRKKAQELFKNDKSRSDKSEIKNIPANTRKKDDEFFPIEEKKLDSSERANASDIILSIIPQEDMAKSKEPDKESDAEIAAIWSENEEKEKGDIAPEITEKITLKHDENPSQQEIEKNIIALELEKSIIILEGEAKNFREKLKNQEESILDIKKILENASWKSPELIQVEADIEKTKKEIADKEDEIAGLRTKLEEILK